MKLKSILLNILLTVCMLTAVWSGGWLVRELGRGRENRKMLESVAGVVDEVEKERMVDGERADEAGGAGGVDNAGGKVDAGRLSGYEVLGRQNGDLAGWVCIEGTGIDYPVMQTEAGVDYYVDHNFEGEASAYGVPFVDGACQLGDGCRNVVVYGHHMKDGSMFSELVKYEAESFYKDHSVIRFDTLEECGEYQVIGVLKVPEVERETEFYRNMMAEDDIRYEAFADEVKTRSLYDCGVEVTVGEQLLTLITCEYSAKNGRMMVVAKKII